MGDVVMKNRTIVFDAPYDVKFREEEADLKPGKGQVLMEKLYSLISTGTELACLSGAEGWFKMPGVPGYCCVSKVVEAGEGAAFQPGDVVFHYGAHNQYQLVGDDFAVRVPEGMDLKQVPLIRMATIAFTAVRVSEIELGDYVFVSGLGLVGNMAAQLATLSGATVIGVDPAPSRRKDALRCGIAYAVAPEDAAKTVEAVTGGRGVNTLIEATGIPKVAEGYLPLIGYHGEIIFLGTPRGDYQTVLSNVLRYCHIDGQGSVTFKGAHEWRYPVKEDKFVKHSIERNTRVCMDLLQRGLLKAEPLISHVIKPGEAPDVYLAVNGDRDKYTGIVIDWT
jgi:2-desacetyl-2-hydroxyethyl bacteriochlorophyllide A dehydrogenase